MKRSQELPAAQLTEHLAPMLRAAYALTGSRHDAEDLVQETFARVLARPRLIRRRDDARYMMRALRNTWIDMQRAREARPATAGAEALERIVDRVGDPSGLALDLRVAFDAMRDLSPKLREAVAAVDVLGMSYREAAPRARNPAGDAAEPARTRPRTRVTRAAAQRSACVTEGNKTGKRSVRADKPPVPPRASGHPAETPRRRRSPTEDAVHNRTTRIMRALRTCSIDAAAAR